MVHSPIILRNISLSFPQKICFNGFNAQIHCGKRIAIIGKNGSGKSSLLKILQGQIEASEGNINIPNDVIFGYLPQIIDEFHDKSGGERLNKKLSEILALNPNFLCLDEPTNHLDLNNRKSLMKLLSNYRNSLIIVTHDTELINNVIDILWHIDNGEVIEFKGNYRNYIQTISSKREALNKELSQLNHQKKEAHISLMQEQKRAKNSKTRGEKNIEQRKWPTIVSDSKARKAVETSGKKKKNIRNKKDEIQDKLSNLNLPEIIKPKFSLGTKHITDKIILSICNGDIYYDKLILNNINLNISGVENIAILGNNGSGKSTLIKAILNCSEIRKNGEWYIPDSKDIGYLDQHYNTLEANNTILETICNLLPAWTHNQIREHLNNFLFRKNEEVNAMISTLSGGEKARASLALISAIMPKILILDEITNNLDLETKEHVIQILKEYPGAMLVISHDMDFLKQINIGTFYEINNGIISLA